MNKTKKNFRFLLEKKDLSRSCVLGFDKSKYKNILVMDGDLQHQPKDIKKLLKIFQLKKAHIVIGSRELFTRKT